MRAFLKCGDICFKSEDILTCKDTFGKRSVYERFWENQDILEREDLLESVVKV